MIFAFLLTTLSMTTTTVFFFPSCLFPLGALIDGLLFFVLIRTTGLMCLCGSIVLLLGIFVVLVVGAIFSLFEVFFFVVALSASITLTFDHSFVPCCVFEPCQKLQHSFLGAQKIHYGRGRVQLENFPLEFISRGSNANFTSWSDIFIILLYTA